MRYLLILGFLFSTQMYSMEELPKAIPEDIKIIYYKPLGHAGHGFSMELTPKICNYKEKFIQRDNEFNFTITQEEFTSIYRTLIKNKVHKISYEEDFIHDYDGNSLIISWQGKQIEISQSGRRIKSSWRNEWDAISKQLEEIRTREYATALKDITLEIDKSLVGNFVHIQINSTGNTFRKYISNGSYKENLIQLKILPGTHQIFCILYKGYDEKKKKEIYEDFDPERSSLWEEKHNQYISSLKQESFNLNFDTAKKKSFQLKQKKNILAIE